MALTTTETRIVAALGGVLFPRERSFPVDARDARLTEWVGDYLDRLPSMQRGQLKALLNSFNLGFGLAKLRPGATFVSAEPDEQRVWIESFENSGIYQRRMLWDGLRTIMTMGYTESGAVRDHLGIESGLEVARRKMAELSAAAVDSKEAS